MRYLKSSCWQILPRTATTSLPLSGQQRPEDESRTPEGQKHTRCAGQGKTQGVCGSEAETTPVRRLPQGNGEGEVTRFRHRWLPSR